MKIRKANKKAQLKGKQVSWHNKAQLKIQEMAFFLVAIMLFFTLVGLFVFSIIFSNLTKDASDIAEDRTLSSITNLADSPEFSCGEPNCVDADKIMGLMQNNKYENFWPFSSLKVLRSSGFNKNESDLIKCTIANYPDCELFEIYDKNVDNERTISNFVALCRVEVENTYPYSRCEVAKLVAGTKLKIVGE